MKQGTVAFILLFFFGLMVQDAAALGVTEAVEMDGAVTIIGPATANSFSGDGSGLTNLNPTELTTGTAAINISGSAGSVATGGVSETALATGAVTPAKISFYSRVAIVATSGGDYDNPSTAMSDYNTWCPSRSSANPCLLKIMPGVYNVGSSPVAMQPYIDIEGSGENVTKINGAVEAGGSPPTTGTVVGASNAEIRFLTVGNTTTGYAAAIVNSSASPSILHVTARASGGTSENYGVYNSSSSTTMANVSAEASGGSYSYGVYNLSSPATMTNVTITAKNSTNNNGIVNSSSSPTMTNLTVAATGGTGTNYGIYNFDSPSTSTNLTVTATGGFNNYGVYNELSSTMMTNLTIAAKGGTGNNFGVKNWSASPTMTNVTITADTNGVWSDSGGTVRINHSVIKGTSHTITNGSTTTLVGNTQLDGGAVSGTLTCVGAYDGNYLALNASCQ